MAASIRKKRDALPEPPARRTFRRKLLDWYDRNGRTLPWRHTSDPYHILVSEIMLQQTQVDRVLPKYHEWLERYPSFEALAEAPESDVASTWFPLGYNIRPRRLQAIAREAVANYGGKLPSDEATLLSFKGIGAYTAGAIRSFAFREHAAILDTNVARVLFRVFIGRSASKTHAVKKRLWAISAALLPRRRAFDFNQALMDFGATQCTARKPKCLICPMAALCETYPYHGNTKIHEGHEDPRRARRSTKGTKIHEEHEDPRRARRSTRMTERIVVVAAVIEQNGRFLVTRRLDNTHLAGYWEFPGGKVHDGESHEEALVREIAEELNSAISQPRRIFHTAHAYPDRTIELHFFRAELAGPPQPVLGQELRWISREEFGSLAFPPADAELIAGLIQSSY